MSDRMSVERARRILDGVGAHPSTGMTIPAARTIVDQAAQIERLRDWIAEAKVIMADSLSGAEDLFKEMEETHLHDGDLRKKA